MSRVKVDPLNSNLSIIERILPKVLASSIFLCFGGNAVTHNYIVKLLSILMSGLFNFFIFENEKQGFNKNT